MALKVATIAYQCALNFTRDRYTAILPLLEGVSPYEVITELRNYSKAKNAAERGGGGEERGGGRNNNTSPSAEEEVP